MGNENSNKTSDGMLFGRVANARVSGNDHWTLHSGGVANIKVSRSRNSNADSRMFRNDDGMLHGGGVANLRVSVFLHLMQTAGAEASLVQLKR